MKSCVARERRAAGADGAEQDLVLLEGRRLEHDADAVRQLPLGDAERLVRRSSRRPFRASASGASSGCVADRVDVGRQRSRRSAALMTAASFASVGSAGRSFSGALIDDDAGCDRASSPCASALTSASVISGRKRWFRPYS